MAMRVAAQATIGITQNSTICLLYTSLQAQQAQTESEIQSLNGQATELAGQIEAVTAAVQQAQTCLLYTSRCV